LEIAKDDALERIVVAAVSKVGVLIPPWVVGALVVLVSAISHAKWGKPPAVSWATMAGTLGTAVLTMLTWAVSHHRGLLGRTHSTLTVGFAGMWFTIATITGIGQQVTFGLLFFGGGILAVGWNIRTVIRNSDGGGHADPLGNLFDQAKASFGLGGARVRTREVGDYKIKGKMALPAGEKTAGDAIKKAEYIESGLRFPPGSVHVAADEDDASETHFTVTDPRVMRRPLPWPGPSRPGGSIADPLRIGLFQDMDPVLHTLPGHHLQIMGQSGSGKSIGGAWNYLAEIITRTDVAVFAVDISKDDQTLGPLRPALHRFETTKAGLVDFIRDLHEKIPQRTKWLARHGYQKWVPGCGLAYWLVLMEEVSKVFDELSSRDEDLLLQIVKELRSAGGSIVMSLQRSDYSQMPTIARGQLAHMCFGVANDDDASFGLSEAQKEAEARPELWGAKQPGMAYLDAPSIPPTHIAMPLRTYAWGTSDRQANAAMTAHAAAWPAAAKQIDEFTVALAHPSGSAGRPGHAIPMPAAGTAQGATPDQADSAVVDDRAPDDDQIVELLAEAAELVIVSQHASAQMLQRKLRLPHDQCLRVLEVLERHRIIGPQPIDGTPRPVLVVADAEKCRQAVEELREAGDAVSEYLRTDDPSPDITAGPDDEIPESADEEDQLYTPPGDRAPLKLSPSAARGLVYDWIRQRAGSGKPTFTAGDEELAAVREEAGMRSRGWIYKVLDELVARGVLEVNDGESATAYTIITLDPLDDLDDGRAAA
jgi:hypothetical protein